MTSRALWHSSGFLLSSLIFAACASLGSRSVRASLDVVAAKEAPLTLIGSSGKKCAVDPLSYRNVSLGQQYRCEWQYSSANLPVASEVVREPRPDEPANHPKAARVAPEGKAPWWWPFGRTQKR